MNQEQMEKPLDILVRLQETDIRIDKIRHFIDHYQDSLKQLDDEKEAVKKRAEEEKAALDTLKTQKAKKELEVQEGEEHIKKCNGRLYAVKTNKEYEATLKEIEEQKQKNSDIETELLMLYDRIDEEEKKVKEANQKLQLEDKEIEEKKKAMAQKLERAKASLPEQEKEHKRFISQLKPDLVENYQWLQQKLGAKVLARVVDEVCQSCFRMIPSQMYNEVLAGNHLTTCPGCNRILVYRETEFLAQDDDFDF